MKNLVFAIAFIFTTSVRAEIQPIHKMSNCWTFSNTRYTEDHTYGEKLIVWQLAASNKHEGTFMYQCGASGSPIRSSIENLKIDEKKGSISFDVKYTYGMTLNNLTKKEEPAMANIDFKGTINKKSIDGSITFHAGESCENGKTLKISAKALPNCTGDVQFEKTFYDERSDKK